MKTILYLLRNAATEANLARPSRLQGRRQNPALARLGVRQAEAARNLLAIRPVDQCYCSPLLRAIHTATIVAAPHGLVPQPVEALTECDVGRWEELDWRTIRRRDAEAYRRFMADPAKDGYPGGESLTDVHRRFAAAIDELIARHAGQALLVVAHQIVNRTYLAGLLGLSLRRARQVTLDTCGISVVVRGGDSTTVSTLNAVFHLQGLAAA